MSKHFLKANSVFVEMLSRILWVEANMRQVQPAIQVDPGHIDTSLLKLGNDLGRKIAFAGTVDAAQTN